MSFLYKLATNPNEEPNFRAFKKEELVELCYQLRLTIFSLAKTNQELIETTNQLKKELRTSNMSDEEWLEETIGSA